MRDWPITERPCEKLIINGVTSLSDAELLAVIIRHGQKNRDALTIARDLLNKFKSLRGVVSANKQDFCQVVGVGEVKYAQLCAAIEIVKRQYAESLQKDSVFNSVEEVTHYLRCMLRDKEHEEFGVLMLDSQHQLIAFRTLFKGTIDAATVYPREVVKAVLADNAAAIILVHNHPSGILTPSQADKTITNNLKNALQLIDVPILDHIIVGDVKTLSMAQVGLI